MFPVTRLIDFSAGADGCAPIPAIGATCYTVLINGRPPMVVGDLYGYHSCCDEHCEHPEICVIGSPTVFVGGRQIIRSTSILSCGDMALQGSPTVFVN